MRDEFHSLWLLITINLVIWTCNTKWKCADCLLVKLEHFNKYCFLDKLKKKKRSWNANERKANFETVRIFPFSYRIVDFNQLYVRRFLFHFLCCQTCHLSKSIVKAKAKIIWRFSISENWSSVYHDEMAKKREEFVSSTNQHIVCHAECCQWMYVSRISNGTDPSLRKISHINPIKKPLHRITSTHIKYCVFVHINCFVIVFLLFDTK